MTQSAVHTSRMSAAKKNKVWTLIVDNGGTAGGRLTGPPPPLATGLHCVLECCYDNVGDTFGVCNICQIYMWCTLHAPKVSS